MAALLQRTRLDRGLPLREQIYPIVRDLILMGKIPPGEIIDEKAIAADLNVSRTPVREAVQRLLDENLVTVVAQSATRAARINPKEIEEAYIIRRALEMESAAHAAGRMTRESAAQLEAILARHARAIERRRFVEAIGIDDSFHRTIADIAGLPRLWHKVVISKAHLDRCRYLLVPQAGEAAATLEQHRTIISALSTGESEKARTAMRRHLDLAYASTRKLFESGALAAE